MRGVSLADFDYDLPDALIAQHPPARRRDARLLVLGAREGEWTDATIVEMRKLVRPRDVLVLNDTRVIPARLIGRKSSGGAVELLLERMQDKSCALVQLRASKPTRAGTRIALEKLGALLVTARAGGFYVVEAADGADLAELIAANGHVPLPPYITRPDEALDSERYQTVFARRPGAVAAPTAGLHFDQALLDELARQGAAIHYVTLHVGAGTFQPLRTHDIEQHVMHAERIEITPATCAAITDARAAGGRVIAIGTTVTRALESAAAHGALAPFTGDTRLFIRPGFRFRVVDALLTNFHLPRSTLLMLVAAFGGHARVMAAYRHAVDAGYRFFSYGDAMWLERTPNRRT
jgi:S-adenosylmethionine:tRNA ribosyltransferase-isomerase